MYSDYQWIAALCIIYDYFEEFTNPLSTCAHNGQIHYFLAHNAHLKKNDLKYSQK